MEPALEDAALPKTAIQDLDAWPVLDSRGGSPDEALSLLVRAISEAGYREAADVSLAIDAAADDLLDDSGTYTPATISI
jgi:hypothetical protein